jgi:hypothetical protein
MRMTLIVDGLTNSVHAPTKSLPRRDKHNMFGTLSPSRQSPRSRDGTFFLGFPSSQSQISR